MSVLALHTQPQRHVPRRGVLLGKQGFVIIDEAASFTTDSDARISQPSTTPRTTPRMQDIILRAWIELRFDRSGPMRIDTLLQRMDMPLDRTADQAALQVVAALKRWHRAGYLTAAGSPLQYQMTDDARRFSDPPECAPDVRLPRPGSNRARLWIAARILRSFDLVELYMAAGSSERSARDFVRLMTRAGYLRIDSGRRGTLRWRQGYRLMGPRHPSIHRTGPVTRLVDHNSGETIDLRVSSASLGDGGVG